MKSQIIILFIVLSFTNCQLENIPNYEDCGFLKNKLEFKCRDTTRIIQFNSKIELKNANYQNAFCGPLPQPLCHKFSNDSLDLKICYLNKNDRNNYLKLLVESSKELADENKRIIEEDIIDSKLKFSKLKEFDVFGVSSFWTLDMNINTYGIIKKTDSLKFYEFLYVKTTKDEYISCEFSSTAQSVENKFMMDEINCIISQIGDVPMHNNMDDAHPSLWSGRRIH